MIKTVCELNKCTGCMACIEKCPVKAIKTQDTLSEYNAVIDTDKCIKCGLCEQVCPNINRVEMIKPCNWFQGWAKDLNIREIGSSGGIATSIIKNFLTNKGCVCSCVFNEGRFEYRIVEDLRKFDIFSGSKYVKSNPKSVYKEIQNELKKGKKVLFIGLPCQAAGLQNYINSTLKKDLYIIDLICHGTPSPKLLDKYLYDQGIVLSDLKDIRFRSKENDAIRRTYSRMVETGFADKYIYSFLECINFTESCYNCNYAKFERCSDITLGDSWGTNFNDDEIKKGISLVLCQTEKGKEILDESDLYLTSVDIDKAVNNNMQLVRASARPQESIKFFKLIKKGMSYNDVIYKCFPKTFIKQFIKRKLLHIKLIRLKIIDTKYNIYYKK